MAGCSASLTNRANADVGTKLVGGPQYSACLARAGRRTVSPRGRSCARATARGHRVGDRRCAPTGGAQAEATLAELAPRSRLGSRRVPMSRAARRPRPPSRVAHVARARSPIRQADVVHGHGAKGGAYARLARSGRAIRVYTPHGGSLHYGWSHPGGLLYLAPNAADARAPTFLVRERLRRAALSRQGRRAARSRASCTTASTPAEFEPIVAQPDASDLRVRRRIAHAQGRRCADRGHRLLARAGRRHRHHRRRRARPSARSRRRPRSAGLRPTSCVSGSHAGTRSLCARPA